MTSRDGRLYGWCIAALVTNMGIIVTGAVVRLTGSGLGCNTWPHCTAGTFTPHEAMGIHSYVEFGNRLLGIALVLITGACLLAALNVRPRRRRRPIPWRQGRDPAKGRPGKPPRRDPP